MGRPVLDHDPPILARAQAVTIVDGVHPGGLSMVSAVSGRARHGAEQEVDAAAAGVGSGLGG